MSKLSLYSKNQESTQAEQTLTVLYKARLMSAHDIFTLKSSIQKSCTVADAIAILLVDNPLSASEASDWKENESNWSRDDLTWFQVCAKGEIEAIRKATAGWVASIAGKTKGNIAKRAEAKLYQGDFSPELEMAGAMEVAKETEPDWIMYLDQDDVLEDRIGREHIERLMTHPNPNVMGYGMSWYTHWDSTSLYRVDAPWGDNNKYRGQQGSIKMYRNAEIEGEALAKECAVRTRSYGLVNQDDRVRAFMRARQEQPGVNHTYILDDEGLQMGKVVSKNGIGLHVLAYEKESPEDYVRLFDELYSIVDHIAVVWTGDKDKISDEMLKVVELYKAELIYKPLDKHLAEARNAGIDYLESKGCAWALFFDPDEVCEDWQQMARDIRRMADITNCWGWMVKFENIQRDGQSSESETLRMTRLDGNGTMRMNGRIHEGFGDSLNNIRGAGIHPKCQYAPFIMVNTGQAMDDEQIDAKLAKYTALLLEELKHDKDCVQAWVALGLQCENDGSIDEAVECYQNGVKCSGGSYLPHRELGSYHLREAKRYYGNVLDRISQGHGSHESTKALHEVLTKLAPERPLLGTPKGLREKGLPLPGISFEVPSFE